MKRLQFTVKRLQLGLRTRMILFKIPLVILLFLGVFGAKAQNALLASEDFSAATGALHNSASGSGWLAAWTTQNNNAAIPGYNIVNTSTPQYAGLLSSGNYAIGGIGYQSTGRLLNVDNTGPFASYLTADGNIGATGKTLFVSVVLRKDVNNTDPVFVLLHRNAIANYVNDNIISVGYFGSVSENAGVKYWSMKIGPTVYRSNVALNVGEPALLVLKMDFAATSVATLYVNPSGLGGAAPASSNASASTTANITFRSLAYQGGNDVNQSSIDEIRIGESFSSVTPTANSGVVLRDPENPANTVAGLNYTYYEGSWNALPDFNSLTAVKSGTTTGFDLSVRNRDDEFAFVYSGFIQVPTDGTYTFFTESDDGSKLLIGSTEVVNNDGFHAVTEVSGTIGLKAGKHAIKVTYFELNGGEILNVRYQGPGITKQLIPASALYRASSGDTSPPTIPSGLAASAVTTSSLTLSWIASTDNVGVTGYEVFRNGVSLGVATGTSRSITGLAAATTYSFTVRARDAQGNWSAQSTALSVTTPAANQPPSVPTGLSALSITQTSFTLSWTASTDDAGVTGYEVFRNGVSLGVATGTSRSITGLTAGTTYSMTVRATDAQGSWSAQSSALNVTTSAVANQPPSVPTGLSALSITQTSFTLSWTASTDDVGVTGYEVFRNGVSLGVATGTSRSITGLTAGTTYSMTVRATDAQGSWSAQSSAYSVTTLPTAPSGDRTYNIGINTNPPNDWNIDNPFADVMRTHRQWKEFGNGSGDGISTIPLDANGWPMTDGTALVFHGARRIHGSYKLSFNGTATVSVSSSASISNVQYNSATNTTTADITIASSSANDLWVTFTNSKRTSASAVNTGVANVKIMRPVSPGSSQSFSTDKVFNDEYTNKLAPFKVIRFMGWMETNWNDEETWDQHTRWTHATQQRRGSNGPYGGSWESVILLANTTGKDAWITLPHKATDDYITKVAQMFRYGSDGSNPYTSPQANPVIPPLNPGLKLYVEYSNEIWNNDFSQTEYTRSRGASYGHPLNFDGETDRVTLGFRFKAMRTVQISNIFRTVFGNDQMMTRVRPVICWQIAYTDLTNRTLSFIDRYYNKRDSRSDWNDPHPVNYYLYGGGGSGYWYVSSSSGLTTSNIWDNGDWNPSSYANTLFADASWAKAFGLTYLAYEGDNHPVYNGDEPVMQQIHWDPRMYQETQEHLEAFSSLDGDAFCFLVLQNVSPAVWGVFNLADGISGSPQYQAIQAMSGTAAGPLSKGSVIPFTRPGGAFDVATYQRPNPNGSGTFNLTANGSEYAVAYTFRSTVSGNYNVQVEYSSTSASTLVVEYAGNVIGTFNLSSSGGAAALTPTMNINVPADRLYALRLVCRSGAVAVRNITINGGSSPSMTAFSAASTEVAASAYPNPANGMLAVSVQGSDREVANITLSDMMGESRITTQQSLADGENVIQLETAHVPSGIYLLTIKKGGKSTQIRLFVTH